MAGKSAEFSYGFSLSLSGHFVSPSQLWEDPRSHQSNSGERAVDYR